MRTLGVVLTCALGLSAGAADRLELRPGDHICFVGNALAERMQHFGALETLLHSEFPGHNLVVRNLGFAGDELTVRLRSEGFGSPDEWLSRCRADVVFAFFGYNESFAGESRLPQFRTDLARFVTATLASKYNGRSAPRLVLFSPIRHEHRNQKDWPDDAANNARLERYTAAMAEVAKAHAVPFVDLFHLATATDGPPLTINGIHLNAHGDRVVAGHAFQKLFGREAGAVPEALNAAVRDKNAVWFQRYRTVDGYSIFGGRADLKFTNDQTNRAVMQREMQVLDVMTANRDRVVWAAAQGKIVQSDDSNLPPFVPVITNKPGPLPGGAHVFLGGDEAIGKMTVANGLKVNLFASEEMFPELVNPVQMAWDARGRLWVAVWPTYPHWKPTEPLDDKILILEDTDGNGRADRCTTFAAGLHCPTGFALLHDGVLVAQAPDVWMLRDASGDGQADVRERVLHGIDSADTHHAANSFAVGPDGAVYFQEGTFHHTQVETPYGPPVRNINAGVYRYEPRTGRFETYIAYNFANPHGHAFDRWGRDIVVDGTGSEPYDAALFSGRLDFPRKHPQPPKVYQQRTRPCPGIEFLSSRHFPASYQGNLLVGNVIGFQGILRYRIDERGGSLAGTEQEPILSSTDPNFRPSDLKVGPDGALYFLDWHNPIIGHMQHNLRDPSRDRTHGRVYRVTSTDRPLLMQPAIANRPVEELVNLLAEPEDRVRERVRMELAGRRTDDVVRALDAWVARLDATDANHEHHLLESLWTGRHHNVVSASRLKRLLGSPDRRVRSAAVRVLSHCQQQVPNAAELLNDAAGDAHPRVRLEAARAASFLPTTAAAEIALRAEVSGDEYVKFVVKETLRHFEPTLRAEIARGEAPQFTSAAGQRHLLRLTDLAKLRAMNTELAARELLERPAVPDEARTAALNKLLAGGGAAAVVEVLAGIDAGDRDAGVALELARMLAARTVPGWATVYGQVERLAVQGRRRAVRQACWLALVNADGSVDVAWPTARQANALVDLLHVVPLLADTGVRARLYPRIEALVNGPAGEVRDAAMLALTSVRGEEAKTFATLARFVNEPAAVRALQRIPRVYWPADRVASLVTSLVTALKAAPPAERNKPGARDAMQFADALAAALPAAEARPIRAALAELGIRLIRIGTVPERMAFDQEVIAVRAGKTVEFAFENTDAMPHNLVVARPGSLEEIGQAAEAAATDPDAAARHYVPRSHNVLLASRLLAPGERQSLTFTAPAEPGVYPYVCTYPGHWRRMYGSLYVVADLEAFQADPVAYLAAHPLPVRDELLKDRRPRTEWTFEELRLAVPAMANGRSFANGKHLFAVASCASCHKMDGVGKEFGPDLTQTETRLTPIDLLRELVEPSYRLNEKYVSTRFETTSGRTITGLVLEETADAVKVIENPLVKSDPVVLKKTEIESREPSPVSLMPKGLLDKLTRDEVLDLLAYVVARGRSDHDLFRPANGAGHRH